MHLYGSSTYFQSRTHVDWDGGADRPDRGPYQPIPIQGLRIECASDSLRRKRADGFSREISTEH